MTPTARTMAWLRSSDRPAAVVEKWVRFHDGNDPHHIGTPGVRRDLFGLFDVLYLDCALGIVGVQCCSMSTRAAHEAKMRAEPNLAAWLKAGGTAELWAWRKRLVKRGGKAARWEPDVRQIQLQPVKGIA